MDRDVEEIDVNQDSPRVAVTMHDQDCQSYYSMGRYYAFTPVPNPPAIQIDGMSAVFCCKYTIVRRWLCSPILDTVCNDRGINVDRCIHQHSDQIWNSRRSSDASHDEY